MINEETIVSVYNDKMTLLQFLKTVNKALDEAVLTSVEVSKKGNATLSFVFDFADGTKIESGEIVLQQGESVTDAKIVDGHLYLTLSNDERLDAGNVKPVTRFEINASQHLIVYYGDGTSQDLGTLADFSNADFVARTLTQTNANFSQTFNFTTGTGLQITNAYNKCEVVNNILFLICNIKVKNISGGTKKIGDDWQDPAYCSFTLPTSIASKIFDIDGVSAHDTNAVNQKIITSTHVTCLSGSVTTSAATTYNNFRFDFTNRNIENGVACYFRSNEIVNLAIDEEIVLMARMAISLF